MSEKGTLEAHDSTFILSGSPDIMQRLDYKGRMISNLQRDLDRAVAEINKLKVENARILNDKNAEIESLKNQIKVIESMKNTSTAKRVIITTENNIVHLFKTSSTIKHSDTASKSKGESSVQKVDSSKANIAKKKSAKKVKEIDVSSIAYNLRSRTIIKSKEMR